MKILHRLLPLVLLSCLLLALPSPAGAARGTARERRARQAQVLVERALDHLRRPGIEWRQAGVHDLERATDLDPDNAEYQLLLARAYYASGYVHAALKRFERVASLMPGDAGGHFGLGQVWRRDWLKYLDRTSLRRSIGEFEAATRCDSAMVDGWLLLSSLRLEAQDTTGASRAAARALAAAPARAEAMLAVASTRWREGDVGGAESAFRAAIPGLPVSVRERFEDIAPLASEADTALYNHLGARDRKEYERRFWTEHDPDLSTPENEAQLEYWARVSQAYFLFYNARHREWDERGEVYVRYGPPEKLDYNPLGMHLYSKVGSSRLEFAMNVLVWDYPSLGMSVLMQDRTLNESYMLPSTTDHDPDPRPNADSLARLAVVGTHELRGVFPKLPPRVQPVPIEGQVASFMGGFGPRVFGAIEVATTPADSLQAHWVVLDSTERVVQRSSRSLSPSACEAERYRVADFAVDLPPGEYSIGMSVRAGTRRGSVRLPLTVPRPADALTLSDIVVTCGAPLVPGPGLRLDPNPRARVGAGDPLTAYFEINHLQAGTDGDAQFEYVYTVKSATRDPRIWLQRALSPRAATPSVEASRVERNVGGLRRQFVSVPVQALPPGRYRLEIQVRDLVAGTEAKGHADFERTGAPTP